MDLSDFFNLSEELCSSFLKNSKYHSIVLYDENPVLLNFLKDSMKRNFDNRGKNIEIFADEKGDFETIKTKYFEAYFVDVGSFIRSYSKH